MSQLKDFWLAHYDKFFLSLGGILIASASFGVGRLTVIEKSAPVVIQEPENSPPHNVPSVTNTADQHMPADNSAPPANNSAEQKRFVASKNGSKYYLPDCSGVKNIKEENKIWFGTTEEAETEGYEPAKNCPGLE